MLHAHGETPRVEDVPEPGATAGPSQVVEVLAAGMNPVEIAIASGRFYGMVPPLPSVVGREGVGRTAKGTRGYFFACVVPHGSFAERAVVPSGALLPIPDAIDDGLAVALGTAGLAAWMSLKLSAHLQPGERVLVLGASGVVGQLGIQAARIMGASRIVAAARSSRGRERAHELGVDETVVLDGEGKLAERLREASGDAGFDVVLDLLWGEPLLQALQALAPFGRVVNVGSLAADAITLPAAAIRGNNGAVAGFTSARVAAPVLAAGYGELVEHALAGRLNIEVEKVPLDEVADAWERQIAGPGHKLVVVP